MEELSGKASQMETECTEEILDVLDNIIMGDKSRDENN
jgi:hypothetical protein